MVLTVLENYFKKFTASSLSRINVPISLDNPQNTLSAVFIGPSSSTESSSSGNVYSEVLKEIYLLEKYYFNHSQS